MISRAWTYGDSPSSLARCISGCGDALANWSSVRFGELPRTIEKTKNELDVLQKGPQTEATAAASKPVENRLVALLRKEEVYWLQRSRVGWMRQGDKNTKFFHRIASGRKWRNWIDEIQDEFGVIYGEEEDIQLFLSAIIRGYLPRKVTWRCKRPWKLLGIEFQMIR